MSSEEEECATLRQRLQELTLLIQWRWNWGTPMQSDPCAHFAGELTVASDALRQKWNKSMKRSMAAKIGRSMATSLVQKMHGAGQHFGHRCVGCDKMIAVLGHIAEEPGSGDQCKDFEGRWPVEVVVLRLAVTLAARYHEYLIEERDKTAWNKLYFIKQEIMRTGVHRNIAVILQTWKENQIQALPGPALTAARLENAQALLAAGAIDESQFAQMFVEATMALEGIPMASMLSPQPSGRRVTISPETPRECATYSKTEYDRSSSSEYMAAIITKRGGQEEASEGAMLGKPIEAEEDEDEDNVESPGLFEKVGGAFGGLFS